MAARSATAGIPQDRLLSFEEFLAAADEDVGAEWVDGEVVLMTPASDVHQDLVRFFLSLLSLFIESRELGWVRSAPFAMYLPVRPQSREPDLLFVRRERMNLIENGYLNGPADMVIEIVSPESVKRDRGEKFVEYEAAGIEEYWLIDPLRRLAEFYRLAEDGRYRMEPLLDGVFTSRTVEGFQLRVDWLWRRPLPKVLEAAAELGLLDG